jgi:hypothetical protein
LTFRLHPKQLIAFSSKATEILYRGPAGGGNPHLMRAAAISGCSGVAGDVSAAGQIADFTANFQLPLGALGTARGSARDTPQAPTSAALARGVGFVRHVLPQSFQNPSKRSDLHENYPADVELTPPTGGPAWRGPSC